MPYDEPEQAPDQQRPPQGAPKYAERFAGNFAPMLVTDATPDEDKPSAELFAAIVGAMGQMPRITESGGKPTDGVKYKYLSEKEILPAIMPIMVVHGLFMYPCRQLKVSEHRAGKMTTRFIGTRFRLCHVSGSYIHLETYGEGFDAGDKACYKAMTGAYKYALRELFMLSGGADPDDTPSPSADNRPAGNPPPGKFDPKNLPPELRFKLYRDTLANATTVAEVEKTIGGARKVVQFSAEQKSALESAALSAATAISQNQQSGGEAGAEPQM